MDFHVATVAQLSAHLRALRKARNLTQANLGRLLGVKQSRIADIESDPGSVSVSQLHKILSALGAHMLLRDSGVGGWTHPDASPSVAVRRLTPSVTPSKSGEYRETSLPRNASRTSREPLPPTPKRSDGYVLKDASTSKQVGRVSGKALVQPPTKSGQYRSTGTSKDVTRASDKPPTPTRAAKKSTGSW